MNFLLPPNKKIYFASDLHLMMAPDGESRRREWKFVQWLDTVKSDAAVIFLLGDMFDFWFEYRHAVPRGFVRLLGKLAELTDSGIAVHFFTGNHDQWVRNYLPCEMNINIYRSPAEFRLNDKLFLLGHGHNSGTASYPDRLHNLFFGNRFLRILYASVHPRWGIAAGQNWSRSSRKRHGLYEPFEGIDHEEIVIYARRQLMKRNYDFFVFGHRHLAMDIRLSPDSRYINTGEWIEACSYAVFDGKDVALHSFDGKNEFLKIQ